MAIRSVLESAVIALSLPFHLCTRSGADRRYHWYVCSIPSRNDTRGVQPSFCKRVVSNSFLGVPSGLLGSKISSPLKPTTSDTIPASSRIVTSSPQPTLITSGESYFSNKKTSASARSSTQRNSRRGEPLPQNDTAER